MKSFLKYVEIQTKVASITPFLIGTLFAKYRYDSFRLDHFLLMMVSLLCFDMATTAINNYIDYQKSNLVGTEHEVHMSNQSVIGNGISLRAAKSSIFVLLVLAVVFGILLTVHTNLVVFCIGVISFITGILYTFGPIPISRMPLGEIFSGFFMGFVILFLAIYVHVYDAGLVGISLSGSVMTLDVDLLEAMIIFLVSIPAMAGIANIMLANNICDLNEDIINNRFTLVYYLGKKRALQLYKLLYQISFLDLFVLSVIGVLPIWMLLVLIAYLPVHKAIQVFQSSQIKSKTFVLAVRNLVIICGAQLLVLGVTVVFHL